MTAPETGLTRAEMELLEFERATWRYPGARDTAIHNRFGHSPTRHAQLLLALIETPAALAYDPVGVNRLRNLRDRRAIARRTSGADL